MKTSHLIGLFLLGFAGFAVAKAPIGLVARLAGGDAVNYARAEGTVWNGTLHGFAMRGASLGDLSMSTAPLSVLALSPRIDWQLAGGPVRGQGQATVNWPGGGFSLANTVVDADLAQLPTFVPLNGTLAASLSELRWGPEGCVAATGKVRTDALERKPGGLDWRGPALNGDIRCAGDRLRLALRGRDASARLSVQAEIDRQLDYQLTARVRTNDSRLPQALPLLGFTQAEDDYRLVRTGTLASGRPQS